MGSFCTPNFMLCPWQSTSWIPSTARSYHSSLTSSSDMEPTVLVYNGEGAGRRSILSTVESLNLSLERVKVREVDTAELLHGSWQEHCLMLCLPGGADLPYCENLNGKGNAFIRDFVEAGGAYLGLCAGAYYACLCIEFELGTPLEVKGSRELAFYPGVARGAVYPGFTYQTEAGTHAAPICFQDGSSTATCRDYSNGGPAFFASGFEASHDTRLKNLATYTEGNRGVAAVRVQVGKGAAVLCGTHPELKPRWLDGACDARSIEEAHPEYSAAKVAQLIDIAKEARLCLQKDEKQREKFWEVLLSEAGLCSYVRSPQPK